METKTHDLRYLRGLIRRRKIYFLIPFFLTVLVILTLVLTLPSIYRSQGTILIEAQNVPEELVQTTVTGYVEERLQTLTRIVLNRSNLEEIIQKFNLYPEMQDSKAPEQIIEFMRRDITMEPVQTQVANPRLGRTTTATIAFTVSYDSPDPVLAARVAGAIVSLYLEQNLKVREEKTEAAVTFFRRQLEDLRREMDSREADIARFKEMNLHALPELTQFNMQMLENTRNELDSHRKNLSTLMNRLVYLQGELASIEPNRRMGTHGRTASLEEELRYLNNQYLTLKAVKAEHHPDVLRLKNQIQSLDMEKHNRTLLRDLTQNLEKKQEELALLRQRYSDSHPDVTSLNREIHVLTEELSSVRASQATRTNMDELEPENPAYINIQTQIASTNLEIENTRARIRELEQNLSEYQQRIEDAPAVEQNFRNLQRDYQSAQQSYQETRARLQTSLEAMELEEGRMAEKLTVIEPPVESRKPIRPNRRAIMLLGLVFASGLGIVSSSAGEYLDGSVRDPQHLASLSGQPVLGSIPYIKTSAERITGWIKALLLILLMGILTAGTLTVIHFYARPLDSIWLSILEKI